MPNNDIPASSSPFIQCIESKTHSVNPSIKYISARLSGGLGNQLFQFAAAQALAEQTGRTLITINTPVVRDFHELTYHKTLFSHVPCIDIKDIQACSKTVYEEPSWLLGYKEIQLTEAQQAATHLEIVGDFLSYRYFTNTNHINSLSLSDKHFMTIDTDTQAIVDQLQPRTTAISGIKTIAVHIRRGDYRTKQEYHPVQPLVYYETALKHFTRDKRFKYQIYVFSDDLEWCRAQELFTLTYRATFVETKSDVLDFLRMKQCDMFIVANSTYSWWAAYLSESQHVIYPKQWFGNALAHIQTPSLFPWFWIGL